MKEAEESATETVDARAIARQVRWRVAWTLVVGAVAPIVILAAIWIDRTREHYLRHGETVLAESLNERVRDLQEWIASCHATADRIAAAPEILQYAQALEKEADRSAEDLRDSPSGNQLRAALELALLTEDSFESIRFTNRDRDLESAVTTDTPLWDAPEFASGFDEEAISVRGDGGERKIYLRLIREVSEATVPRWFYGELTFIAGFTEVLNERLVSQSETTAFFALATLASTGINPNDYKLVGEISGDPTTGQGIGARWRTPVEATQTFGIANTEWDASPTAAPVIKRYRTHNGAAMVSAWRLIDDPRFQYGPFFVMADMEERSALAGFGADRARIATLAVAAIAVVVIGGVWLARTFSYPLTEIARVASAVSSGTTDARMNPVSGREMARLRTVFNDMLDAVSAQRTNAERRAATQASTGFAAALAREIDARVSSETAELRDFQPLVASLSEFGRPLELDRRAASFREIADQAVAATRDAAKAKDVSVELEDGLLGKSFDVDPNLVARALIALMSNAIEAVRPGGTVVIVGGTDGLWSDRGYIEVLDDGPGFLEEQKARLFDPLFTTHAGRSGMGLPTVKRIVELHGGTVTAKNRLEGGGASVQMGLPAVSKV